MKVCKNFLQNAWETSMGEITYGKVVGLQPAALKRTKLSERYVSIIFCRFKTLTSRIIPRIMEFYVLLQNY